MLPINSVQSDVTISCMSNIPVDSIELTNRSSSVLNSISNAENHTTLEYTIPLVTDDLHGQQYICIAMAGDTTYTEAVEIQVEGTHTYSGCDCVILYSCQSLQSQLAH